VPRLKKGSTSQIKRRKRIQKNSATKVLEKDVKAGGFHVSSFVVDGGGNISEFYEMEKKKLGEGSYGTVCRAKNKTTGVIRACKSMSKGQMKNLDRFKQEINIMKSMDHPNICKLYETFEDTRKIYLIMELCTGGELFDKIIESGNFTEAQAAITMQHLFRAIFYMHENHICHRDLKPENFLFATKDTVEKSIVKVIDFGLATTFTAGQVLTTKAGTPYYVAPQVLAGKYCQESDLWSMGVIMYVLICGYPPFHGDTDADVLAKVRLGNFSFQNSDWKNVSEDAKTLIRNLLKMNPKDRYTAEQALNNTWIKNKAPKATGEKIGSEDLVKNLKKFRSQNQLKKAALHVIAQQLNDKHIKKLRENFIAMDVNGDGSLTTAELVEGLKKAGMNEAEMEELTKVISEVDADGSGSIDYTEFLAATLEKRAYMEEDICWQAFRVFDRNGDGKIDKKELSVVLQDPDLKKVAEDIESLVKEIDTSGDGEIDFQEFMVMMKAGEK